MVNRMWQRVALIFGFLVVLLALAIAVVLWRPQWLMVIGLGQPMDSTAMDMPMGNGQAMDTMPMDEAIGASPTNQADLQARWAELMARWQELYTQVQNGQSTASQMSQINAIVAQMQSTLNQMQMNNAGMTNGGMSNAMPMDNSGMGMMDMMMGMMGMGGGMPMDNAGMSGSTNMNSGSMNNAMPMDNSGMGMIDMMMGMMGMGGMSGSMNAAGAMNSSMPMDNPGASMSGDTSMAMPSNSIDTRRMMEMLNQMMETMNEMQRMVNATLGQTSNAAPVSSAPVSTTLAPSVTANDPTDNLSQTSQIGAITVTVTPFSLTNILTDTVDFYVTLDASADDSALDLTKQVTLLVNDQEIPAQSWTVLTGNTRPTMGKLRFPTVDATGKSLLTGATRLALRFRNPDGDNQHVFMWDVPKPG